MQVKIQIPDHIHIHMFSVPVNADSLMFHFSKA